MTTFTKLGLKLAILNAKSNLESHKSRKDVESVKWANFWEAKVKELEQTKAEG
jgi:hypothetical protein